MTGRTVIGASLAGALGVVAYQREARPRLRRWGATADELARALPGDDLVARPRWTMTFAISIQAPPEAVWPWLAQIGYQRGGLYSYDWLDRLAGILDRPSAERILPEFQELAAGDVIPLGAGPSWPVAAVEPGRALVLAPVAPGFDLSWAFVLCPAADGATRLVTRARAGCAPSAASLLLLAAMDPMAFVMTRKMLLNIKLRAERLALAPGAEAGFA